MGAGDHRIERVDGAEHVGDPRQRDDSRLLGDELIDVRQVQPTLVGDTEPAQLRSRALRELLPRHDIGVVLHLGDHDLVILADATGVAQHPGHQVERFGGVLGEHDFFTARSTDERGDLRTGVLEGLTGLSAELVHRASDIGVVIAVVIVDRVDDARRLLRGVGAVEVDQRFVVGKTARQDREVFPDPGHVEQCRFVGKHPGLSHSVSSW